MATTATSPARESRDSVVIRFAGDSGDGMQVTGGRFTVETALAGNDLTTFPDYPAEIRAPAGTTYGVSAFQIHFGAVDVMTPGDQVDVLVAMNPAALKVDLKDLRIGGTVVVDTGAFTERNLAKAGFASHPLEDGSLAPYQMLKLDITKRTLDAVKDFGLHTREAHRCRNMWALGLMLWMYGRDRDVTVEWLKKKFAGKPEVAQANVAALNAGHAFGETAEMSEYGVGYTVRRARVTPGVYRTVSGTEAIAWGLVAGMRAAGLEKMVFAGYPITPASLLLHTLANLKRYGVITFQAEDEIAAIGACVGAAYAGALGVTSTSGPGMALKTEMLGLAIATELPLVVVNSQRTGPSTGMPTKAEQSDLFQAVHGRNADAPLAVLAAATATDCFDVAMEAVRIATTYMTPVVLLSDAFLAHAAEPWRIPDLDRLPRFPVRFRTDPAGFHPFLRNPETLSRPWARPGTPGLEHRIGGLEKDYDTGHISYDPENHARMTRTRAAKIAGIANAIPLQTVALGADHGAIAVVGWGSTYGAIHQAVRRARQDGVDASHIHLRYLSPFPRNLGELLARFERIVVPELNNGQLVQLLRAAYLVPAEGLSKVQGKPFKVSEIVEAIR
ncbi:MAG: 2-oxoglutarate ferredoxin oxidoreductase subunit alpha [Gemmatimonadetes bacterium 13_1_40CM_4_69_8]|nr:MAG: 2-oxoglutarate ferredoxin oxidoreductase subunit alpha [Gemmatimonadetes bacterium 13_1_40CM_69_22]OLC74073.1 MAG: 2-oxoglutarate ferredoxin oxidoreductase subunit alpha [Gemmatimonadetes bacterium 13_1_40CM_4_69_8]